MTVWLIDVHQTELCKVEYSVDLDSADLSLQQLRQIRQRVLDLTADVQTCSNYKVQQFTHLSASTGIDLVEPFYHITFTDDKDECCLCRNHIVRTTLVDRSMNIYHGFNWLFHNSMYAAACYR